MCQHTQVSVVVLVQTGVCRGGLLSALSSQHLESYSSQRRLPLAEVSSKGSSVHLRVVVPGEGRVLLNYVVIPL